LNPFFETLFLKQFLKSIVETGTEASSWNGRRDPLSETGYWNGFWKSVRKTGSWWFL